MFADPKSNILQQASYNEEFSWLYG